MCVSECIEILFWLLEKTTWNYILFPFNHDMKPEIFVSMYIYKEGFRKKIGRYLHFADLHTSCPSFCWLVCFCFSPKHQPTGPNSPLLSEQGNIIKGRAGVGGKPCSPSLPMQVLLIVCLLQLNEDG